MAETHEEMLARMERMRVARTVKSKGELTPKQQADMAEAEAARHAPLPGDDELEAKCQAVLDFVGSLDPGWKQRLAIMREVRMSSARQDLGAMCGYVLDRSLHLEIPAHPFFEPGNHPMREKDCEWTKCRKPFRPAVPGQRFCSNDCGIAFIKQVA